MLKVTKQPNYTQIVFPKNTQKNTSPHVWKVRHIKNSRKHNIKTKVNSNSTPKLDTSKSFYILALSKTILFLLKQNILKNLWILTFHLFLPLFVTYRQRQLKQRVNRKHTQQKSRENRESR